MAGEQIDYGKYFENLQNVAVSIALPEEHSFEGTAAITSLQGDLAWLEVFGAAKPHQGLIREGAEAFISAWAGGALCRCRGEVCGIRNELQFCLQLQGAVRELQRREFFRLDVAVPLEFEVLPGMTPDEAVERWVVERTALCPPPEMVPEGTSFKVTGWKDRGAIPPQRINLSGGGMRFRNSEPLAAETLLLLQLFLPGVQPRVVSTVSEVIRSTEITSSLSSGPGYFVAIKFLKIGDKDREAIISYLFSEQRRELLSRNGGLALGGNR